MQIRDTTSGLLSSSPVLTGSLNNPTELSRLYMPKRKEIHTVYKIRTSQMKRGIQEESLVIMNNGDPTLGRASRGAFRGSSTMIVVVVVVEQVVNNVNKWWVVVFIMLSAVVFFFPFFLFDGD